MTIEIDQELETARYAEELLAGRSAEGMGTFVQISLPS